MDKLSTEDAARLRDILVTMGAPAAEKKLGFCGATLWKAAGGGSMFQSTADALREAMARLDEQAAGKVA
jgi:hypothetical protein